MHFLTTTDCKEDRNSMWVIFSTNDNISSKSMLGEASNHKSTHTTKFELQKLYYVLLRLVSS